MTIPKIYIASKVRHAPKWRALRSSGVNIISTWIDEAGAGEPPFLMELSERCIKESIECDAMIVYAEAIDILKGAYIEMGAALSVPGKLVYFVGEVLPKHSAFSFYKQVSVVDSIDNAILCIMHDLSKPQSVFDADGCAKMASCRLEFNEYKGMLCLAEITDDMAWHWKEIIEKVPIVLATKFINYANRSVLFGSQKITAGEMRIRFNEWVVECAPEFKNPMNLKFA